MVIEEECRPKAEYKRGRGQRQFLRLAKKGIKGEKGKREKGKRRGSNPILSYLYYVYKFILPPSVVDKKQHS